jgi:polyisoprenoid-binding protein YceI
MRTLKTIALALFVTFGTTYAVAQNKAIDTKKSTINWVGKKMTGEHTGTINFSNGTLSFKGGKLTGGNFTVDMPTLTSTDLTGEWKDKLNGHLKSDDFFGTDKFKTSTMVFKKIASKGNNVYTVTADLTIKGITNPVSFDMTVNNSTAVADVKIDRTKYDIKYKSGSFFENLGDKAIYDDFDLKVNLQF